ncbi:MAG: hypothetical protein M1830_006101 [Pleopsidium flavum]|nr:MAG: hypothetical protein M1830_006101 [Pleopsidium flavum]
MSGGRECGAGGPPATGGKTAEEKEREERLMAIQMEALGSQRRERISTEDSRRKQMRIDSEALETSRLVNKAGSGAFKKAQENQEGLSSWNDAWKSLTADSSAEVLQSLDDGQSHRAGLSAKLASNYDDDPDNLQHHGGMTGRGGRGGGSGRGGGVMGTRARGDWRQAPVRTPSHPLSHTTPKTFGLQGTREHNESSSYRKPTSFSIPKQASNDRNAGPMSKGALQLRQTIKEMPPTGPKGKQVGNLPFKNTTGSRGQPSRARVSSRASNRAAAPTSVPRRGNKQSRQPSPDYESRLASPEAFLAAGTRIISPRPEPKSTTASSTGIPPPQATSAAVVHTPPVRSSPIEPPKPIPTVRLPPVDPKPVPTSTKHDSQPENSAKPCRKSVRFADFSEATTSVDGDSLFGAQVDLAPAGVHVLSTPSASMSQSPPSRAAGSYFDDLLGLEMDEEVAPEIDANQIGMGTTEEIEAQEREQSDSQAGDAGYQEFEDHEEIQDDQEAEDEKEVASLNHIISSLQLTDLAPRELIVYYENQLALVQARMQERLSSRVPNSSVAETSVSSTTEASAAESPGHPALGVAQSDAASTENTQGLSQEVGEAVVQDLTRDTEASNNGQSGERSIIGEHIHKSRFNRRPSSLAQPEPQPTLVVTSQATARPSPLTTAPQATIDLRSSLWRYTVVDLTYRPREQLEGEDIIGEHVLPGARGSSQAAESDTSTGRPLIANSASETISSTSTVKHSTALVSTNTAQAITATANGVISDTVSDQSSSRSSSVAWPNITGRIYPVIPETAATQQYGGRPTVEASSSVSKATQDELETTTPPQAKSIARPNITGTTIPNIPDSAATRQYARSITSESVSSTETVIAPTEARQNPRTTPTNQPNVHGKATQNLLESSAIHHNARATEAATANTRNISHTSSTTPFPPTHGIADTRANALGGPLVPSYVPTQNPVVPQPTQPPPSSLPQPIAPSAPLATNSHAPRGNTRSSRRGAAPMISPFLQSLQGASALPASGVGSATWMQYNQGPAAPAKNSVASSHNSSPVPSTQTSPAALQHAGSVSPSTPTASPLGNPGALSPKRTKQLSKSPAKDAWGKVRREGN